eukprot:sb/3473366/
METSEYNDGSRQRLVSDNSRGSFCSALSRSQNRTDRHKSTTNQNSLFRSRDWYFLISLMTDHTSPTSDNSSRGVPDYPTKMGFIGNCWGPIAAVMHDEFKWSYKTSSLLATWTAVFFLPGALAFPPLMALTNMRGVMLGNATLMAITGVLKV